MATMQAVPKQLQSPKDIAAQLVSLASRHDGGNVREAVALTKHLDEHSPGLAVKAHRLWLQHLEELLQKGQPFIVWYEVATIIEGLEAFLIASDWLYDADAGGWGPAAERDSRRCWEAPEADRAYFFPLDCQSLHNDQVSFPKWVWGYAGYVPTDLGPVGKEDVQAEIVRLCRLVERDWPLSSDSAKGFVVSTLSRLGCPDSQTARRLHSLLLPEALDDLRETGYLDVPIGIVLLLLKEMGQAGREFSFEEEAWKPLSSNS